MPGFGLFCWSYMKPYLAKLNGGVFPLGTEALEAFIHKMSAVYYSLKDVLKG